MAAIVVVDDNAGARLFARSSFKGSGHVVTELEPTCLFTVLQALHASPPDLLISDLVMPTCPGQTLIRACREDVHLKDLKILLLTAHGDVRLAHFLQEMGNTHYLTKPVAPAELRQCAELFLTGKLDIDPGWELACDGVVAVVDDSRLSRAFHAACLRRHGFRPLEIEPRSLMDTVAALEQAAPQLLLLDYLMPQFRGDALVRALQGSASLRDLPVILVTAHRGEEITALPAQMPQVEVLHKPTLPETLALRVRARLRP